MRPRPGVTLVEVLAAIFVMAIGLLALLVLYPVGALSMARGVRDDRAAAAAANAASLAVAFNLRNDPTAVGATAGTVDYHNFPTTTSASVGSTVYVDPFYVTLGRTTVGDSATTLGRYGASYASTTATQAQFFTFQEEIVFDNTGLPVGAPSSVNRPATYTFAYLLRRRGTAPTADTEVSVVVYASRSTQLAMGEPVFTAAQGGSLGTQGTSTLGLTYTVGNVAAKPNLHKGDWVLDVTPTFGPANGYFYRIDSIADDGAGNLTLQLESTLKQTVTTLVGMENVITVLDRGVAWKP